MSTLDINKVENEEENKTPDKKQIEAEEKEIMLKSEEKVEQAAELTTDAEGPVKAALASDVTEQGREVKPKFIPIGAIKMPGFFTRNSDKEKSKDDEAANEKDGENEKSEEAKPKRHRLQFLHTCPFTQFMHHPRNENAEGNNEGKRRLTFNMQYPKLFQRRSVKDPEATLASMETLEDKLDTPNDGMENVKLDPCEVEEGKVATKLPLKERIRQKKFIIDDIVVCCLILLVLLVVIIGIAIGARAGPPAERPLRLGRYMTTLTSCGPVEGILDEGVYKFYGIPYAVPPVGERRFTYAQPLNNISLCWNGTLLAHERGPPCAQFVENGTFVGAEDCLTLDVVTPHVRYDSPLPVVVLLGAASPAGGPGPARPSAMYARTKEVVFVRPNFRLGALGFLAVEPLARARYPPTAGNYALSDVLAALRWVRDNAAHFGGDARAVTVLAHRAGATLAAALPALRRADGLYARAWLSSPATVFPAEPLEQAYPRFDRFLQLSKCSDAACLRRMPLPEILAATPDVWLSSTVGTLPLADEFRRSWLVMDGDLLREPVNETWVARRRAKDAGGERSFRPIVLGTTQHSAHTDLLRKKHNNWTAELVEEEVKASALGDPELRAEIFKHVNKTYEGLAELISAVRTLCPLLRLARAVKAPLYVVLAAGAGAGGAGRLAAVDADVQAILGTFDSEVAEQRRFMAAMQQLFYYFVWHGALPGPESALIAVGQDLLPLAEPPLCRLLAEKGLLDRYAHVD